MFILFPEFNLRFLGPNRQNVSQIFVTVQPQPYSTSTQVGSDKVISWTTHTTLPKKTFKALLDNLGSWFLVCKLILTQLDNIWKMTTIFLKMEDGLNFFQLEDNLIDFKCKTIFIFLGIWITTSMFDNVRWSNFFKLKTTSFFLLNVRRRHFWYANIFWPNKINMEDDQNIYDFFLAYQDF